MTLPPDCGTCSRYWPYYDDIAQIGGATSYPPSFALHHVFSWVFPWHAIH
jgi:hypothetical protein